MSGSTNGGRARAYQALRESEELHRLTLSSISDAVFLTDDEGRFTFICPNVDVIFGYGPDEVQAVSDTGRGIPADQLPRLFDAFFTTKKDGLGLGPAIARSIVDAHGGRIWAEDGRGRGATFRVILPVAP
jgi:PAS domain S-box-containing protein